MNRLALFIADVAAGCFLTRLIITKSLCNFPESICDYCRRMKKTRRYYGE